MKALFFVFVSTLAFAQGNKIPNLYSVDPSGEVFRGREPDQAVNELKEKGVTDVIIFKNDLHGEVKEEAKALKALGIHSHLIPFKWKDINSKTACKQAIDALALIKELTDKNKRVYFHCTAGEDRTGLLAGLWRIYSQGWSPKKAFKDEMCARGYSDGDAKKPSNVTAAIEKGLTPLYEALSEKISEEKPLSSVCSGIKIKKSDLKCR